MLIQPIPKLLKKLVWQQQKIEHCIFNMHIYENYSLKCLNTLGVEALARYYIPFYSEAELQEIFSSGFLKDKKHFVLGGGSNVLFTEDYDGVILHNQIFGISIDKENTNLLHAKSGEVWHKTVLYSIEHGLSGLENLSLIPGSVGAAPVQNIGAYGVEVKDVIHALHAFDTQNLAFVNFSNQECGFEYRDSIFKSKHKGRYIITEVSFQLSKQQNLNTSYGAIEEELKKRSIVQPSTRDISDVVSAIRVSKLPDPSTIGNAGSFFKNPVLSADAASKVLAAHPNAVHFKVGNQIKFAAGWLIESCGFKGVQHGNTGTWKNQALVIVNHGGAKGNEIYDFSTLIIDKVNQVFGIVLEREVNIL
jgi:UDP-N-acetylmuramate dehydrogenase